MIFYFSAVKTCGKDFIIDTLKIAIKKSRNYITSS